MYRRWATSKKVRHKLKDIIVDCSVCNTVKCRRMGGNGVFRPISGEISAEVYRIEEWYTVSRYHVASVWYDLARYFTATIPEIAGAVESAGGRKTEENHLYRWENHTWEQAEGISSQSYRISLVPGEWILPWAAGGGGRKEQWDQDNPGAVG